MNKLHKIFGGLVAALALVAYAAMPAMAADDGSDTHTVSINSGEILMIDVADRNSTINSGNANIGASNDVEFDFSGDFDAAGANDTASDNYLAEVHHTANTEFTISTCLDGSFNNFASGSQASDDSASYLRADDADNNWTPDRAWYAWGSAYTIPSSNSAGGDDQDASDCDNGKEATTQSFSANADVVNFRYEAKYDVADGEVLNEEADIQWTIQ